MILTPTVPQDVLCRSPAAGFHTTRRHPAFQIPRARRRLLILILLSPLLVSCKDLEKDRTHAAPKYDATHPLREDISLEKQYVCQIQGIRHIEIRALERGYLEDIFVDEGQLIRKGELMFRIMPNVYQAELAKAKAEASTMEIEYNNTKGLAAKNIVSQNELALAKARLDKANAEVSLASTHLGFTEIKAPFDGIMDHLRARNGSLLDEGELLTTLSDTSRLWVYFNVPEAEYLDYKTKKKNEDSAYSRVRLKMANGALFEEDGQIETIEADFDNTAGNIEFRAVFQNPQGLLRHGQTGTILMKQLYPNALLIPQKATFEVLDQMYVYVVNGEGKVEQRPIKIEAEIPYFFLVREGLGEHEIILTEGLKKVRPGEAVTIELIENEALRPDLELHAE